MESNMPSIYANLSNINIQMMMIKIILHSILNK
jgi:hypothetical protein